MKIAILGIGGVGGVVGGVLARRYSEVYFYTRGENLRVIRENGLNVESASLGNFTVRPKLATNNAAEIGPVDALFFTSKGFNICEACLDAAPMIGSDTAVIPLLNGVNVTELMAPHLPPCILADGLIRIMCHLKEPGRVYHQSDGLIKFGLRDGGKPPILTEIASMLEEAGIPAIVSDDILLDNWIKYAVMGGFSVVFCWYGAPAGDVQRKPGYQDVVRAVVGEIVSLASAKGVRMPEDIVEKQVEAFSKLRPETVTSLYRDLSDGKSVERTELSHLIGNMIRIGKETGVPTPYHQAVWEKYANARDILPGSD